MKCLLSLNWLVKQPKEMYVTAHICMSTTAQNAFGHFCFTSRLSQISVHYEVVTDVPPDIISK